MTTKTREQRYHLIDRIKVGSWWTYRFANTNPGRGAVGPRQVAAIDASNPLDVRVSWQGGGKVVRATTLVHQYDPCEAPPAKPVVAAPAKVSPLNGAGEAIREIVRDEIRAVLSELRPIVREEARAALADAFGEGVSA